MIATAIRPITAVDRLRRSVSTPPPMVNKTHKIVYLDRNREDHEYHSDNDISALRDAARHHNLPDLDDPLRVRRAGIKAVVRLSDKKQLYPRVN